MKQFLLLVILTIVVAGCSDGVELSTLKEKGGTFYTKKGNKRFSGKAISYFSASKGKERRVRKQGEFSQGKKDGVWIVNSWNGEWVKKTYKAGKLHGESAWYYRNGNKKRVQEFQNNRPHGYGSRWKKNGEEIGYDYYEDGAKVAIPKDFDDNVLKRAQSLFDEFGNAFR